MTATAPYTSIDFPTGGLPMPARMLWPDHTLASTDLQAHDRYTPALVHGWIDVTMTALTPVFVGVDNGPHPFRLGPQGRYAIPDSTVTGLLRSTVRIITGGRLPRIDAPILFFREPMNPNTADTDSRAETKRRLRTQYLERGGMGLPPTNNDRLAVGAGYLSWDPQRKQHVIHPINGMPLKVSLAQIKTDLALDGHDFKNLPNPQNAAESRQARTWVPAADQGDLHGLKVAYVPGNRGRAWSVAKITGDIQVALDRALDRARTRAPAPAPAPEDPATGVIYLTGITGVTRKTAYIFPDAVRPVALPVDPKLSRLVESATQITDFQRDNFPPDGRLPTTAGLRQPVWFTYSPKNGSLKDAEIVAFGRAGGFRVSTDGEGLRRAIPDTLLHHTQAARSGPGAPAPWEPDVPQALFGDIDLPTGWGSLIRRVRCSTLVADDPIRPEEPVRVQLLGPQRSCYLHYLTQPTPQRVGGNVVPAAAVTWANADVSLRGYKIYLHGNVVHQDLTPARGDLPVNENTVRAIQPLPAGTVFRGRITFTNLARSELGILLIALRLDNPNGGGPPDNPVSAHKIGLGKPLGYGSVHLGYTLHTVDPSTRYGPDSIGTSADGVTVPSEAVAKRRYLSKAASDLLCMAALRGAGAGGQEVTDINELAVIKQLNLAARWKDRLAPEAVRTMDLSEFDRLQVLPPLLTRFNPAAMRLYARG